MNRKRQFVRTCKKHGLNVQPAALQSMIEEVNNEESLLQSLKWINQNLPTGKPKIVSPELWKQAFEACIAPPPTCKKSTAIERKSRPSAGLDNKLVEYVSAFEMPRLMYDSLRQQFYFSDKKRPPLFGTAQDKVDMMTQRYMLIHQRVVRQMNTPLTTIDLLLGSTGSRSRKTQVLLGMLHYHPEGLELEDLTGTIVLKGLDQANIQKSGFYSEGTIVMVNGQHDSGYFFVERMGFPMLEPKAETAPYLPPRKRFVGRDSDQPLIIYSMSNIELDDSEKRKTLEELIDQIADEPREALLVLFGNFSTTSLSLSGALDELASMLEEMPPNISVVVLPGPKDTPSQCWPLPAMKSHSLSRLPRVQLASNPCKIRYADKELVLVRKDLIRDHLHSQVLNISGSTSSLASRVFNTTLSQGHIMPQTPIYWNYDHAMHLYPLPELILMALDNGEEPVKFSRDGCHIVSPGEQWAKVSMSRNGQAHVQFSQDKLDESSDEDL
ncbi:unnamed protein product [Cylindrotheca closterium]|uniref:DNA polymerase II subunit 2 n=1 Tax=Cylindrotheca closterium TaxID=2856 RepID=A0AAD2CBM3_9STRA|nr:unnamed protein product [Cylindrotheca closterium]